MTLKLGTIGTTWITQQFIEAAHATGEYVLTAVYSRRLESGQTFAAQFGEVPVFTELADMLASGLDVLYIASPNSLHFEQVKAAIQADVHIIVEKSAFENPGQYAQIKALLTAHPSVRMFEAARHIQQPNFKALATKVAEMEQISGATFVYEKYSSRFDAYLAGENPNVLNREFAAGALADLGIYPLYAALRLFGMPVSQHYFATKLNNGTDGRGTAILRYTNFDVTLIFGKGANSYQHSEILGLRDTILIDSIAELNQVEYDDGRGARTLLSTPVADNPMLDEAKLFADIIKQPVELANTYTDLLALSEQVNAVLTKLREDAGVVFPSDH
ncbi:MAG: Gfo/Idh/MocA family oxidoreductase [Lactobacillaceae bacterium]|jgi:predicted dehydrogenase|nr:Gfo/Idh/MocA family oxidoreductase [Lactobacillaceae bacterium]